MRASVFAGIRALAAVVVAGCGAAWGCSASGLAEPSSVASVGEGWIDLMSPDLGSWRGLPADPPVRAKMSRDELAIAQFAADARMRAHWHMIEEGGERVLAFDGRGDNLCTREDFEDFELELEWRIGPKGDSGIYLRGTPQVQIWDDPLGSGGLYNNQKHASTPRSRADRPPGEWNTFRIRMVGDRVWVWLNGVPVTDGVVLENYWNRAEPVAASGAIELQNHGNPLWFRGVRVRRL